MRRSRFLQAGILSFCLIVGHVMLGCGDEGEVVTIDLCALSLEDMNTGDCMDSAYAEIEDFTVCYRVCGNNAPCMKECLGEEDEGFDEGFGECYGDLQFLVSGQCGDCYIECYRDLLGDESACLDNPGDPGVIGAACLDDLYSCVNGC